LKNAETHERLVDVKQDSVMWIHLHVAVSSVCDWLFTSQPCCVLCFIHETGCLIVVTSFYGDMYLENWTLLGGMLCIAPRGLSCRIELHSFIARYCCLQAWRKPPRLCLFFVCLRLCESGFSRSAAAYHIQICVAERRG
jgi:hypothetical protein